MSTFHSHGGRRLGAGRKKGTKTKEASTVIRIPVSQKPLVQEYLSDYQRQPQQVDSTVGEFSSLVADPLKRAVSLFGSKVPAGFPSPADEHVEKRLDPNDFLIDDAEATFFVTIQGFSMIETGLMPGDKVVVDRSKQARIGDIVLAVVDGEFTIKLLQQNQQGQPRLLPANSSGEYLPIELKEGMQFEIWGVVTGSFRRFK